MSNPPQVIRPPNPLRAKVGGFGGIDADAIAKAEAALKAIDHLRCACAPEQAGPGDRRGAARGAGHGLKKGDGQRVETGRECY